MRVILAFVVALIAWWFVTAMVGAFMMPGILSTLLGLIVAIMVFAFVKNRSSPPGAGTSRARYPQGFEPAFEHDNIAIDQKHGKLWIRDKSGHETVVDKGDILRWNEAFISNGPFHFNNRIEIHVRDLNRPIHEVSFRCHSETWKWSAPKNQREMEEWQSRLTTWKNNS